MKLPKSFYFYLLDPYEFTRKGVIFKAERVENSYIVYIYGHGVLFCYKIPQKKITKRFILELSKGVKYEERVEGIYDHVDTKKELLEAMKERNTPIRIFKYRLSII